jgi:hypothetical protein
MVSSVFDCRDRAPIRTSVIHFRLRCFIPGLFHSVRSRFGKSSKRNSVITSVDSAFLINSWLTNRGSDPLSQVLNLDYLTLVLQD